MDTQLVKERVREEREALTDRIKKLDAFIQSDAFDSLSLRTQALLHTQYSTMMSYASVLLLRLENWED